MRYAAPSLIAGIVALMVVACSGEPPSITRVATQLIVVEDLEAGTVGEELSVHIVPEDKDGLEDLEYLHVVSDPGELYWTMDSSSWTRTRGQNDEWLGSARLSMPPGEPFPRGEYRLLLYDLAGDSDEETFRLDMDVLDTASIPFPRARIADDKITLDGGFAWYTLLLYSTADTYVRSYPSQAAGVGVETIRKSDPLLRGGFRFWVYTYWSSRSVGLLSGPYAVD